MVLSIIIPMYNVERYICKCLESVIYQENAKIGVDYEVVIINDGSTDNSLKIATDYIMGIDGINIYSQKNQGMSVARNRGLKLAVGEYIWFIDSDDWIEPFSVRTIIDKLNVTHVDVLKIRAYRYISDTNIHELHPKYNEDRMVSGRIEGLTTFTNTPAQFNIYNKCFIEYNDLYFMPSVYHEDNEFIPRMYWYAKSISFLNTPLYFHRRNPFSVTSTPNPKRAFDLIKVCASLSLFSHSCVEGNDKKFSLALSRYISISLNAALHLICKQPFLIQKDFNHQLRKHKSLFAHLKKSGLLKYMIEALLFNFCSDYSGVYHILNNSKDNFMKIFINKRNKFSRN